MDFNICLISRYTASGKDEKKYFRLYFEFEHLRESVSAIDQSQFWTDLGKWHMKERLKKRFINSFFNPVNKN
jgi:hypothetical protein